MSEQLGPWLSAFALTQAVELPIYLHALRERIGERSPVFERLPPAVAVAFAASVLTHPIVWFVIPRMIPDDWLLMAIVAEAFAILAEAAWLRAFGLGRALAWAAFANAASVLVGFATRAVFDWP